MIASFAPRGVALACTLVPLAMWGCGNPNAQPADTDGPAPPADDSPSEAGDSATDDTETDTDPGDADTDLPPGDSDAGTLDSDEADTDAASADETDTPPAGDTDPELPPGCAVPVAIAVAVDTAGGWSWEDGEAWVVPNTSHGFRREAGTGVGPFVWSMASTGSGGLFSPATGFYVAGRTAASVDRIQVTDAACGTSDEVLVRVVTPFILGTYAAEVDPAAVMRIPVSGGSGDWECFFDGTIGTSGASRAVEAVDDVPQPYCRYTAGSAAGTDHVRVRDLRTGVSHVVRVDVQPDTGLSVRGTTLYAPIGVPVAVNPQSGSGVVSMSVVSGDAEMLPDGRQAVATGYTPSVLRVVDDLVEGLSLDVDLVPLRDLRPPDLAAAGLTPPVGQEHRYGDVVVDPYLGDFAVGLPRVSGDAAWSGVVGVWSGSDPEPVLWLSGESSSDFFGESVVSGDFDGDGALELAVGAPGALSSRGLVYVYGSSAGWLDLELDVALEWTGTGQARLGADLAVCDFNGDGLDDLAVGTPGADDQQGRVLVYWGSPGGISHTADDQIGGAVADGEFGSALSAGDFGGDEACDLAVGSPGAPSVGGTPNVADAGGFAIHLGSFSASGLAADPWLRVEVPRSMVVASDQPRWGQRLAAGDLDGDGLDDLVASAPALDRVGSGLGSAGGVYGWLSSQHDDAVANPRALNAVAHFAVFGSAGGEFLGCSVHIQDAVGDADPELLLGACGRKGDAAHAVGAGVVEAYEASTLRASVDAAVSLPVDASGAVRAARILGPGPSLGVGSQFGRAVGVLPDTDDADNLPDIVVVAPLDSADGFAVGRVWRVPFAGSSTLTQLTGEFPRWSGRTLGARGTFDFIPGGAADAPAVLLGDPLAWEAANGPDAGEAWVAATALSTPAFSRFSWRRDDSGRNDRFGFAAATIGNFSGDSVVDRAVAGWADESPIRCSSLPAVTDGGALWIYTSSSTTPQFVAYGSQPDRFSGFFGGPDVNGDGWSDLWVAASNGRLELFFGKSGPVATPTEVLCPAAVVRTSIAASGLGRAFANLGDLNGDGCEETAIAAPTDKFGAVQTGGIRVLWGFHPVAGECAFTAPRASAVRPSLGTLEPGDTLAAADVTGDGTRDLWIGVPGAKAGTTVVGALHLVSGADLAALTPVALAGEVLPSLSASDLLLPAPVRAGAGGGGRWPSALAVTPLADGSSAVWIGAADALWGAGTVEAFRYRDAALSEDPVEIAVGRAGDRSAFGSEIRTYPLGSGRYALGFGAPRADSLVPLGVDVGAVYVAAWP